MSVSQNITDDRQVVLVAICHPDDELQAAGPTIRLLQKQGFRIVVVLATQGSDELERPKRVDEMRASCRHLGAELEILDPPGYVRNESKRDREGKIVALRADFLETQLALEKQFRSLLHKYQPKVAVTHFLDELQAGHNTVGHAFFNAYDEWSDGVLTYDKNSKFRLIFCEAWGRGARMRAGEEEGLEPAESNVLLWFGADDYSTLVECMEMHGSQSHSDFIGLLRAKTLRARSVGAEVVFGGGSDGIRQISEVARKAGIALESESAPHGDIALAITKSWRHGKASWWKGNRELWLANGTVLEGTRSADPMISGWLYGRGYGLGGLPRGPINPYAIVSSSRGASPESGVGAVYRGYNPKLGRHTLQRVDEPVHAALVVVRPGEIESAAIVGGKVVAKQRAEQPPRFGPAIAKDTELVAMDVNRLLRDPRSQLETIVICSSRAMSSDVPAPSRQLERRFDLGRLSAQFGARLFVVDFDTARDLIVLHRMKDGDAPTVVVDLDDCTYNTYANRRVDGVDATRTRLLLLGSDHFLPNLDNVNRLSASRGMGPEKRKEFGRSMADMVDVALHDIRSRFPDHRILLLGQANNSFNVAEHLGLPSCSSIIELDGVEGALALADEAGFLPPEATGGRSFRWPTPSVGSIFLNRPRPSAADPTQALAAHRAGQARSGGSGESLRAL